MDEIDSRKIITGLVELGRNNRISRRKFIQTALTIGVTVTTATSLWSTEVAAQTPKKGGKLRIGKAHGQTSDSLDPGTWENGFMLSRGHAVNNYLTEVDATGSVIPELAESWEASADASTWTFKLRQDTTFHNGKEITADDVVDSVIFHRGEASQSAAKPIIQPVTEVKADGKHTVIFTLEAGNADFPFIMTDYHLPVLPANGDGTIDWQSGIGAGGYVQKNFEPGVRLDLEKDPNYWKSDRAHFDSVEQISIIDPASRTNALVSGEVDTIDRVDLKTVSLLQRMPGIRLNQVTGTQHFTFPMRTNIAPFDNNDVRLALKHAINREELVEKILQGFGEVGNDHPIGSGQQYYAAGLEQTSYDPERATEYLKKAGMEDLSVDLHVADAAYSGAVDAAVLFAEHAKPAGITINVVREPNDGYWSNVWNSKPFCACYWGGRPTADWMFSTAYASGVPWNDTVFEHERFNELLVSARAELDQNKRRDMYFEMQQILNREGGTITPMFASFVFATAENVGFNEPLASNWDMDGERSIERWWFNS